MHYIRLLRPPKLSSSQRQMQAEIVFTVTTDLGDSFLSPLVPLDLFVTASIRSSTRDLSAVSRPAQVGKLQWASGQRVAKPICELPLAMAKAITSGDMVDLGIGTAPIFSAEGVERILSSTSTTTSTSEAAGHCGLVMPVRATLNGPDVDDDVSSRKIRLHAASQAPEYLEIEEEIGESIARHIWDAGVVALSAIVGTYTLPDMACSQHACMKALRRILDSGEPINILEIGCGVGILGTGLCAIYPPGTRGCTILMTDLDEAEGRARSNIALLKHNQSVSRLGQAHLLYENLDWEHARHGRFGRQVQRRRWDLVVLSDCTYNVDMLPALVETLSALHASNVRRDDGFVTRVFLATKPRHESEKALFDLLAGDGWETLQTQILPLPVLGKETESVEMYLFEKASCPIRK